MSPVSDIIYLLAVWENPACVRASGLHTSISSRQVAPLLHAPTNTELPITVYQNREHPTGTERKSLTQECGWKGGDRGGLAEWKKTEESTERAETKLLTGIGLLMEGPT